MFYDLTGLELAYTEAPRTMQSIIMGLFWFCQGLGSLLGTATVTAFKNVWFFNWDHGDINCQNIPCPNNPKELCSCHLDYYFYFLAGLQVFGFFLFVFFAWMLSMGAMGRSQRQPGAGSPPSASSNQSSPQRSVRTLLDSASHVQQDQGSSYAYSSGDTDIASWFYPVLFYPYIYLANTRCWTNVDLMLAQRRRQQCWTHVGLMLGQRCRLLTNI